MKQLLREYGAWNDQAKYFYKTSYLEYFRKKWKDKVDDILDEIEDRAERAKMGTGREKVCEYLDFPMKYV